MSAEGTTTGEAQQDATEAVRDQRPVEERAEEIVERVSGQVAQFARRLVGRAREEVEDIVAEAQTIRRGGQRPPD
jgi:DNA-directed RNA polymerase specialized sigma24 family protein